MQCDFCGRTFNDEQSEKACSSCALFGGCRKVKCPHCEYEMPRPPKWVKWLRERKRTKERS